MKKIKRQKIIKKKTKHHFFFFFKFKKYQKIFTKFKIRHVGEEFSNCADDENCAAGESYGCDPDCEYVETIGEKRLISKQSKKEIITRVLLSAYFCPR